MAKRAINYCACSWCLTVEDINNMYLISRRGHNTYYCDKCNTKTQNTEWNLGLVKGPKPKKEIKTKKK